MPPTSDNTPPFHPTPTTPTPLMPHNAPMSAPARTVHGGLPLSRLHIWQIQPVRDLLVIGAAVLIVWLGHKLSIVTVPMLLALLLAYLFEPLVAWLVRRGWFTRRGAAITIILLGAAALIGPVGIGGGFAVWQGVRLAGRTVRNVDNLVQSVAHPKDDAARAKLPPAWQHGRDWIVEDEALRQQLLPLAGVNEGDGERGTGTEEPKSEEPGAAGAAPPTTEPGTVGPPAAAVQPGAGPPEAEPSDVGRMISWVVASVRENAASISQRLVNVGTGIAGTALDVLKSVGALLFMAFLTSFFFYFFCTGYGEVQRFWEGLIPEKKKGRFIDLAVKMDRVIAGFVRGRLTVAGVQIVVYTVLYWIIGVPAPLIVGPIMGILTIVPYASGVAAPIAMVLMWLDPAGGWRGEWWWIVGGPLVVLAITQVLDDYILTPLIQGKATNMDVPTILFASIAGGSLAGFYGVLVAIPVAACLKILLKEVFWPRFRAWSEGRAPDVLPIKET
jgi:predicted PurR-regulated permease PerM